ncbi:MAG: hypothetical protein P8Z74_05370 [Acidobacteriota bacterium]
MENENNVDTIIDDLEEETGIGKRETGSRVAKCGRDYSSVAHAELRRPDGEDGRTRERENGNWGRVGGVHDEDIVDGADIVDVLNGKEQSENP